MSDKTLILMVILVIINTIAIAVILGHTSINIKLHDWQKWSEVQGERHWEYQTRTCKTCGKIKHRYLHKK